MQLSKSDYLTYLRHPAWLWLKKHQRDVLPATDPALQALFDAGNTFEHFAEQVFPDGQTLGFDNFQEYKSLPGRTATALASGARTIFQGRFEYGKLTCIIDVLQRVDDDQFDLFEIKASTRAKREHIPDLAFQVIVLEGAGIRIRNVGVIHVNNSYVRQGPIDIQGITTTTDVTDKVIGQKAVTQGEIDQALSIIASKTMPDPSPRYANGLSEWMKIYTIVQGAVEKTSIYNLAGIKPEQIALFEDAGVYLIEQIPDDIDHRGRQERQIAATKSGERHIDRQAIKAFIGELEYPLYFLDYETFSDVIPVFDGLRPYQAMPFQYSLHIMDSPEAPLRHREYLHGENGNPVDPLLTQLREDIGDQGSVVVWYDPFETGRNRDMAAMFPEHTAFLESLNERVVDLMDPFKAGWFVDGDFLGSASIKKVLPVLVPELSYDGLEIASGDLAQLAWMDAVIRDKSPQTRDKVLANLRDYCELDTLAMVRIFEVLRDISMPPRTLSTSASPNFFSRAVRAMTGTRSS